jgi:hypothetical protein
VIEQGLVMLIQAGLAATTPPLIVPGGFFVQLPKDLISAANPMAWSYRWILDEPTASLGGQGAGLTAATVQLDCHGFTAVNAIVLARAITKLLRGSFRGVLPDPDGTLVDMIFKLPGQVDGFCDANRAYVRSLEYSIHYSQI